MSSPDVPWFFSESLRTQCALDIKAALEAERISNEQSLWLESLVGESYGEVVKPRVDRLLRGDAGWLGAELAGALIFSDASGLTPQVYLSTLLNGLERFDSRQQLLAGLSARFDQQAGVPSGLEVELIEGDLFEQRMLAIVDQQVLQLQRLTGSLQRVPSVHSALSQTFQQQVDAQLPTAQINVFTHLVQIRQVDSGATVGVTLGSQTLADIAMDRFANTPLATGLRQQWLNSEGRELNDEEARPWQQALASVSGALPNLYENLLADYWRTATVDNVPPRQLACQTFAEGFRQDLLAVRHKASLSAVEYAGLKTLCLGDDDWADGLQVSRLSIAIGSQEPIKLAGVFLILFKAGDVSDVFLYSAKQGLRRFSNFGAVAAHFAGIEGRTETFGYTSLNDHSLLRTQGPLHLRLDPVSKTPLNNVVDSLIGLQKRDLQNVLKGSFTSAAQAEVKVHDALDIRTLIDPLLMVAGDNSTWNDAMASSERSWAQLSSPARVVALTAHAGKEAGATAIQPWAAYLRDAAAQVENVFAARPSITDCAHSLLNRYFSVLHGAPVDVQRLWFRDDDNSVVSLSILLLEQVTGHREAKVPQDCKVYIDPIDSAYAQHLSWLTPALLDQVMARARKAFGAHYSQQLGGVRTAQLRIVDSSVIPAHASRRVREGLLRLELDMQRNNNEVSRDGLNMLQQVLDRPVSSLRQTLGLAATEVYVPTVTYDSHQPAVPLTNVMVLQQPLNGDCKPLLWSANLGLQEFESVYELLLDLSARFFYPESRDNWLELLAETDRDNVRRRLKQSDAPRLTFNMNQVNGHFLEQLDNAELQRQCQGIESTYRMALDWQADAGLVEKMLLPAELDDKTRTVVDMLSSHLQLTLLSRGIPGWLKGGSIDDVAKFRELLVSFGQRFNSKRPVSNFCNLTEYTVEQLQQRLHRDFPDVQLNPDRISITLTRYTPAPVGVGEVPSSVPGATNVISESLTFYAINRFYRFQDATLSISSDDATPLPAALDALYIREMVRTLDIATSYEQYLKQVFSETASDYADRLDQFTEQAPYALLLLAYELKMQSLLSITGYDFIENVITMPDGLARLPVNECKVTFSPLKLVAAEGYAADIATGIFLIGPANQEEGPWILHAVADPDYFFKEYPGKSELLTDLYTSSKLQALVLERLDPEVRFIYERNGFMQPHLSWASGGFTDLSVARPGPVQLSIEPQQGNVLYSLFRASQQIMLIMAKKYGVTTAQADSAESRFLLLLGTEQALMFLPGKVGGLLSLWQARDLFHSSLESASDAEWGKAAAELAAALAVLVIAREQSQEKVSKLAKGAGALDNAATPRWHDPQLRFDPSGRLRAFEVHDVSLSDLQKDQTLDVFTDPVTLKQYAALFGKVYRIKNGPNGWCVINGDKDGPRIKLDNGKRWVLDSEMGTRQGGSAMTTLRTTFTDRNVDDVFTIEARGIAEIERLSFQKAVQIREAHSQARLYLENALNNLTIPTPQTRLDPRVAQIIMDFFGVKSAGNVPLIPIKQALLNIYAHLLHPDLSPYSSARYIAGSNKPGSEQTNAFTFSRDPLHRIYLSERFFSRPPVVRLKSSQVGRGGFNIGVHYRASVLIHEISHIANDTHDIAYVESNIPFLDLMDDTGSYRARVKLRYAQAQHNLSHLTPRDELFRVDDDNTWRDLKAADGDAKDAILRITDTDDLEAARDKFMHDAKIRSKIILSNADSVALLATLLGRERFLPGT